MPKHEVEKGPISERNKLEHGLELLQHSLERAVPFHSFQEYSKNLLYQNFGDLYPNACQYKTRNGNSPCSIWLEYVDKGIKAYNNGPTCVSDVYEIQKFKILIREHNFIWNSRRHPEGFSCLRNCTFCRSICFQI